MAHLKAVTAYLTGVILLILPLVYGAALPSSVNALNHLVGRQTSSTRLCEGDKINGALLNTFTPENPPSVDLIQQCSQLFSKTPDGRERVAGSTGTESPSAPPDANIRYIDYYCWIGNEARTLDIHIAILHVLHMPDRVVASYGKESVVVFRWGEASIIYKAYHARGKTWRSHAIANAAAMVLNHCSGGDISNTRRVHGWYYGIQGFYVDAVEIRR